jgi:fructose-specific phosphotransferase system IIC component
MIRQLLARLKWIFASGGMFCAKIGRMKNNLSALLTVIAGVVVGGLILNWLLRLEEKIAWDNRPRIGFQV